MKLLQITRNESTLISYNFKKHGSWVLVIRTTNGIGNAFAFKLASRGLSLVLGDFVKKSNRA
ncbi:hypothetical protein LguiA_015386 [Lonicera macranthoides]